MSLPLVERKRLLEQLVTPLRGSLVFVGELPAQAALFDQAVLGGKLEGFVAKRA